MNRAWKSLAGAPALLLGACSVLYDPSQFRGVDAAGDLDASADLDASPTVDASAMPDAFAEPDDAALDARPSNDAFTPLDAPGADVPAPPADGGRDAVGPDAWASCPVLGTSPSFATCADTGGLYYCPADDAAGDLAMLTEAAADVAVPAVSHRLTLLGNAIEAWRGAALHDFELVREGDRVAVVTSQGASLARHRYDVTAAGLSDLGVQTYLGPGGISDEMGDIAISPGVLDGVAVMTRQMTGWGAYTCPDVGSACVPTTGALTQQPRSGTPFLAYAGTTLVAQVATTSAGDTWFLQRLDPAPYSSDTFMGPAPERLRGVDGELVLPDGLASAMQRAYEPDDTTMRALLVGHDEPRLARDGDSAQILARARETAGGLTVSILGVDCSTAACGCRSSCAGMGFDEAFVPVSGGLVDWTFDVVDGDLRVATFLVGDSGGTNVVVAWWRSGGSAVAEPLVIASGRLATPPGIGSSLRSVVRHQTGVIDRLEVLVAADVTLGGTEFVFLSGLRLEGCSS